MFESGCTRTFTTVFEPLAPSRSDSDVDRERTQREANIETRRRKGFIVRRADEKAVAEVEVARVELASGYVECLYTGLLTLTAPTLEFLDQHAADLEQVAANAGIELQPLWGRQADGWVSSLPARSHPRPPDRGSLMLRRRSRQHESGGRRSWSR